MPDVNPKPRASRARFQPEPAPAPTPAPAMPAPPIYQRGKRWYADGRGTTALGNRIVALKPPGSSYATTDEDEARTILAHLLTTPAETDLEEFAARHCRLAVQAGKMGAEHAGDTISKIARISTFLETRGVVDVRQVARRHIGELVTDLLAEEDEDGDPVRQPGTVRKFLTALSAVLNRAVDEDIITKNPCSRHPDIPATPPIEEARILQPHQTAALLEEARKHHHHLSPYMLAEIATFAYTGARKSEGYGFDIADFDFNRRLISVTPKEHRGVKTLKSKRTIPFWDAHAEIMEEHFAKLPPDTRRALPPLGKGEMKVDPRHAFSTLLERAGITERFTLHQLRHTYASVRLQMHELDPRTGVPVSVPMYTVARELGHADTEQLKARYGHTLQYRFIQKELDYAKFAELVRTGQANLR